MTIYLLRRVFHAALMMVVVSAIVFIGVNVIGDPVEILVSPAADQMERDRAMRAFGLDQPLWLQYFTFLGNVLSGDLGRSFVYNRPAMELILERMPATLELAFAATFGAVLIGLPLGLYAGLKPKSPISSTIMATSIVGFSLPSFWVGLMLILLFSVYFGWLPSSGRGPTVDIFGTQWSFLTLGGLSHLALPALNLALFKISLVIRLTRSSVSEIISMDYVKFARSKGLGEKRIIFVHILKNVMIPVITVVGLELGSTIAFSVVTESIFGWPGMGKLIIDSINALDRPVIVAYLMIIVVMFVMINLVVDLIYTAFDPRIKLEGNA